MTGIDSVLRAMDGLTVAEQRRTKQAANMSGARLFRNAVKSRIPRAVNAKVRTYRSTKFTKRGALVHFRGQEEDVHLRNRIGFKHSKRTDKVIIGYVGLARAYGHIVEYGKREGRPFVSAGNGQWARTFAEKRSEMLSTIGDNIGEQVVKTMQRNLKRQRNKVRKLVGN